MKPSVLVGHSGLVGGNLLRQHPYDLLVNSMNAEALRGGSFGQTVFSAARAEKWRANADPDTDARHIDVLIDLLGSFSTERLTLVSTVDVYASPIDVDESTEIDTGHLHAYGANRFRLEQAAAALHPRVLVVRLPALFGPGLKKNVVYDLLHDNQVERIQPDSSFQWYDLRRLGSDLDLLWADGGGLANLATAPVRTAMLVDEAFGRTPLPANSAPTVSYDVRTLRSSVLGGPDGYVEDQHRVVERLREFVRSEIAP